MVFFLSFQEINRSNRRIMKQTFVSDVLEIQEPVKPVVNGNQSHKVTVDPETDDWDCKDFSQFRRQNISSFLFLILGMFDDNGDCLDPKLLDELTASVGKVSIEKPKSDYKVSYHLSRLIRRHFF